MLLFKKPGSPIDFIIAGLGNPGPKYENTRHNAGFMALDALADKHSVRVDRLKWSALVGEGEIGGKRCLLMKPQTFMNCSGEAVSAAMHFYKLSPEQVIVMLDDINLDEGVIRIRRKGSDGGQRGMRSIIDTTGFDTFPRIKLGVGKKPHPDYDLASWVLSKFPDEDRLKMKEAAKRAAEAAEYIVGGRIDEAMNIFSR